MAGQFNNARYRAAREIVAALRAAEHQAYFAGGCVRDLLLGIEPKDFDVATSATPTQVEALFRRTQAVGAHFGVMLVLPDGSDAKENGNGAGDTGEQIAIEVATFRHDGAYSDGRR